MSSFSILVFNADGDTLRFELFAKTDHSGLESVVHGKITSIGGDSLFSWSKGPLEASINIRIADHKDAADWVLEWLRHLWPFGSLIEDLKIVAHHCINCSGSHAPAVMVHSRFPAGYPIVYKSDARCIIAASQQLLPGDVKLVVVFNTVAHSPAQFECNQEAEIANLALDAVQTM